MRPLTLFVLFLAPIVLLSCTRSSQEDIFDNYLYRLQNSLQLSDVDKTLLEKASTLPRYPSKRLLEQAIEPLNINLLDFLRLSSCELQRHLGQRNSSLGIFMLPSQQLLYEYQFLKLAKECLQVLPADNPLHNLLSKAVRVKQRNLPYVQANAVFTSDEFVTLFSLGSSSLGVDQVSSFPRTLLLSLDQLEQFVEQPIYDSQQIEQAYSVIGSSKYIGQLRLSMEKVRQYLVIANQQLQYRIDEQPLCINGRANQRFEIVYTVFNKFYIAEIQRYMAELHQQANGLLQQVDQLVKTTVVPEEFSAFWQQVYRGDDSEWHQYQQAIKQHTVYWQKLLRQCGRSPGST